MNRKAKALEFVDAGYNIQITGRHIEITNAIKEYVLEKISKLERFMNRIIDVIVILDIQKLEHRVELLLNASGLKIMSQAITSDMYVSIDQAVAKLEAQILRYKSKIQDYHAKGRAVHDMPVDILSRPLESIDVLDSETEDDNESDLPVISHRVVKQETLPLKTLTYDEAVMKMELSGDALTFLIFKNEADQRLKIIYRLENGDYGIVEPHS